MLDLHIAFGDIKYEKEAHRFVALLNLLFTITIDDIPIGPSKITSNMEQLNSGIYPYKLYLKSSRIQDNRELHDRAEKIDFELSYTNWNTTFPTEVLISTFSVGFDTNSPKWFMNWTITPEYLVLYNQYFNLIG